MQVKRFVAANMRRALELVRQELGPEAIILSSKRVEEGVELLTTLSADEVFSASEATGSTDEKSGLFGELASHKEGQSAKSIATEIELAGKKLTAASLAEASANEFLKENQIVNAGITRTNKPAPIPAAAPEKARPHLGQTAAERYPLVDDDTKRHHPASGIGISALQEELSEMRQLLEAQLTRLNGAASVTSIAPTAISLVRRLEQLGLSKTVIKSLVNNKLQHEPIANSWSKVLTDLSSKLPVCKEDITGNGGVFAFVGPTGVGKTTTIAKLAARYVLKHGADKVALITTDMQRIGAYDQLRSLARILQVPVRVVDENNSLESVVRSLRRVPLVLIDTAGLSHGDPALKVQMAMLAKIPRIQTYLVMATNVQEQMLKASVHAYRRAGLKGCVLTKLDETTSFGGALGIAMQESLSIAYTTNGQEIPADISVATGHSLVTSAVHLAQRNIKASRVRSL